jgi:hypothetical protein
LSTLGSAAAVGADTIDRLTAAASAAAFILMRGTLWTLDEQRSTATPIPVALHLNGSWPQA